MRPLLRGKPIERGIDHLTVEQLVGAVGLPAFLSERHKHLPTIGLATCTLHKTLGHKLADGCRKSRERHIEARGNPFMGLAPFRPMA